MTKFASLAACFLFVAAVSSRSATVTTTADSGPGSLREAIANAISGETITFTVSGIISLTSGQLTIDTDLTIIGPGPGTLVVERAIGSSSFRVFNINVGVVGISGITVRGGEDESGGGINNEDTLSLTNVVVMGNSAGEGGGGGIRNNGTMFIVSSLIVSNQVTGISAGGGGINNIGALVMDGGTLGFNIASGDSPVGGGLRTEAFFSGLGLLIEGNRVVAQEGTAEGGGIYNNGTVFLDDSTVRSNLADGSAVLMGGNARGGGVLNNDGTISVARSTFSGNSVLGGAGEEGIGAVAQGGGVANLFGTASLTNSTVSGNSIRGGSGAMEQGAAQGGGLFSDNATTRLFHSTVVSNAVNPTGLDGGGLFASGGTIEMRNTILAVNLAMFDLVTTNDATFDSSGFNLIGSVNSLPVGAPGDQFDVTAAQLRLGPLQNNGGPTFTHALECGSIARDAGGNANAPATDQRGAPRIINDAVDIGSYEATAFTPGLLEVTKSCPATAVAPGDLFVFEGTITNVGLVALTNIIILNDQPVAGTVVTNFARLEPGEGRSFTGSYLVPANTTACQLTDTLTAQGNDLCGGVAGDTDSESCAIAHRLTIVCPADVSVQCPAQIPAPNPMAVGTTSSSGSATVEFEGDVAITNGCSIEIRRTYSATDSCSNRVDCQQIILVQDTTAPVLEGVPANATFQCPTDIPNPPIVTALDNCDGMVDVVFSATTNGTGPITIVRTWTAVDRCTNSVSASQTITLNDLTAPTLIGVPPNRTFQCLADVPPPATVTAGDNCDSNVVVTVMTTTNGTCPTFVIHCWQAVDQSQNVTTACQTNIVQDTVLPVLSGVPGPETYQCLTQVPNPPPVTALDNCEGMLAVTFSSMTTGTNPLVVVRTWTAVDRCTNSVSASQTITINDVTAPTLIGVPPNRTFQCLADVPPPATVTAGDNCDSNVVVTTTTTTNGTCPTFVIHCWQAVDQSQNVTTACQTNIVQDTVLPVLSGVPGPETYQCLTQVPNPPPVTALDNCEGMLAVTFSSMTTGTNPLVVVRTWTAVDRCTNSVSASQTITINDVTAPTLIGVPPNRTYQCLGDVPPPATVTAGDNCDNNIIVTVTTTTNGTCPTYVIHCWQAVDQSRNVVTACQTNIVQDTMLPVLSGVPGPETYQCLTQVPNPPPVTALDNCEGVLAVTFSSMTSGTNPLVVVRTWTAVDRCTNSVSASQTITINDVAAPTLIGVPPNRTYQCLGDVPPPATVTAGDNCDSNVVVTVTTTMSGTCPTFVIHCWQAVDQSRNVVTACQTNTVQDTIAPMLSGVPANGVFGSMSQVPPLPNVTATDNCSGTVPVTRTSVTNDFCPSGRIVIRHCWTATDACLNTTTICRTNLVDCQSEPCFQLSKTVDRDTAAPGSLANYTYSVTNCGSTILTNLVVVDDNGTPTIPADDFVVATNIVLSPGQMRRFTNAVILPVPLCAKDRGDSTGIVISQVLSNGNIRVMFVQSTNVNDNTYGANSIGWTRPAHPFKALVNSDQAEFEFRNRAGQVVLRFKQDYITASGSFPSGYGSLGVRGGDGAMVSGNAAHVLAATTSLTENLNKPPFINNLARYTVDSPAASDPNSAFWEYRMIYTVVIDRAAFGSSGFGGVMIVDQHNSPPKNGDFVPAQCNQCVTNIAVATAQSGGLTLTQSDNAVVCVCANPAKDCQPVVFPCVQVIKRIACLLPGDQCGNFDVKATGFKGSTDPAFCYSITVSNCGAVALTDLRVTDSQWGDLTTEFFPAAGAVLGVKGSMTKYYKMAWSTTTTNVVKVTGRAVGSGGSPVSAQDTAVATVRPASITCQALIISNSDLDGKTDHRVRLPAGSADHVIKYKAVVCNSGEATITGLMIESGITDCGPIGPFSLAPGQCVTNDLCTRTVKCSHTPLTNRIKVVGMVTSDSCNRDLSGQPIRVTSLCEGTVECQGTGVPAVTLVKKADRTTVTPGSEVTYTYTVKNTGPMTLTQVEVTDDNGTPSSSADDFVVGTVPSLGSGAQAELKRTVLLPVTLCSDISGEVTGMVIPQVLPNGNIRVMFIQDTSVNDNTYGVNASGWGSRGHKFSDLVGSDQAEFQFRDKSGQVVLQFRQDYLSSSPNFPSGYTTLGVNGGDGEMVTGNRASVLSVATSLAENLNKAPFLNNLAKYLVDSPSESDPNRPFWEVRMIYTVVVDKNAFGSSGFGGVMIVDQHNSPAKSGKFEPVACASCVTNIARVVARSGTTTVTSTSQAVVCSTNSPEHSRACPLKSDYWKKNPGEWTGFSPGQTVVSVFSKAALHNDAAGRTLIEAVDGKAGAPKIKDLLKQAVTALLNAQAMGGDYPFSVSDIIEGVNMALMNTKGDGVKALTDLLKEANEDKECGKPPKHH